MITTYIRSSSLNTWMFCQQQYFINYILGVRQPYTRATILGTAVHKTMECLAAFKKYQQDNPKKQNLVINDDALGTVSIKKKEFLLDSTIDFLCEKSCDHYHTQFPFTADMRKECSELSYIGVQHNNGQFDPRYRNIVDVEPHFDLEINEPWAKYEFEYKGEKVSGNLAIKGTVDLITSPLPSNIEVVDYKTSKYMTDWATDKEKNLEKLRTDPQLLLYNYAISRLYPQYEHAAMTIFFLRFGCPITVDYGPEDREAFLEKLRLEFVKMKATHKPQLFDSRRKHFKCNKVCFYCKNKWEGTDKNMCEYVEGYTKQHGLQKTIQDLTVKGHTVSQYEAPG